MAGNSATSLAIFSVFGACSLFASGALALAPAELTHELAVSNDQPGTAVQPLQAWFDAHSAPAELRKAIVLQIQAPSGPEEGSRDPLTSLVDLLSQVDSRIADLLTEAPHAPPRWLTGAETPPLVSNAVRLEVARAQSFKSWSEETLCWSDGLAVEEAFDPALLWYLRAVAHHQLVQLDDAREAANQLLNHEGAMPRRYTQLARLILLDTEGADPESLGYVARQMRDVRRRLQSAQLGDSEQDLQQEIIDALDKKIDGIEEELKKRQQQMAQSSSPGSPSPMEESMPAELKGAGEIDPRRLGPLEQWGAIPPKERERITQEILRGFPSHYQRLIMNYYQDLATDSDAEGDQSE